MDPENVPGIEALLEEGLILYGLGKFEQAADKWNKVLVIDPKNDRAVEYLDIVKDEIDVVETAGKKTGTSKNDISGTDEEEIEYEDLSELVSMGLAMIQDGNPENAYKVLLKAIKAGADTPETHGYFEIARAARLEYYKKLIPDLNKTPNIVLDYDSIKELKLSKEEGFVLSQIDGMLTYEDVLTLSRMDKLDVMGILSTLIFSGVIKSQ